MNSAGRGSKMPDFTLDDLDLDYEIYQDSSYKDETNVTNSLIIKQVV